jgi:hypothetical protein
MNGTGAGIRRRSGGPAGWKGSAMEGKRKRAELGMPDSEVIVEFIAPATVSGRVFLDHLIGKTFGEYLRDAKKAADSHLNWKIDDVDMNYLELGNFDPNGNHVPGHKSPVPQSLVLLAYDDYVREFWVDFPNYEGKDFQPRTMTVDEFIESEWFEKWLKDYGGRV